VPIFIGRGAPLEMRYRRQNAPISRCETEAVNCDDGAQLCTVTAIPNVPEIEFLPTGLEFMASPD
jgi:hypothetical protein